MAINLTTDYIVRPLQQKDTGEVLKLIETCLGNSIIPRTAEFWEWKHFRNPFGISPGLVAENKGKIIALRIFMRWLWHSSGGSTRALRAVDTVTHPDWRGKGIFADLTNQLVQSSRQDGISFIFNTPNQSSMPGYLKMGWQKVANLPLQLRLLGIVPRPVDHSTDDETQSRSLLKDAFTKMDASLLLQDISRDPRLHTARSKEYLLWRYAEIPGISYHCNYRSHGDAFAMAIYRTRGRNRFHELSVSEFLLSEGQSGIQTGNELLQDICGQSNANYAVAIASHGSSEAKALSKARFYRLPVGGPPFTVRLLNGDSIQPSPLDWASWRCSIGDLELF